MKDVMHEFLPMRPKNFCNPLLSWDCNMKELDKWYDTVFANAVAVECTHLRSISEDTKYWHIQEPNSGYVHTHRALLINIKPIAEPSAEDHLRIILKQLRITKFTSAATEDAWEFLEKRGVK